MGSAGDDLQVAEKWQDDEGQRIHADAQQDQTRDQALAFGVGVDVDLGHCIGVEGHCQRIGYDPFTAVCQLMPKAQG
jgi:hypothetical protein